MGRHTSAMILLTGRPLTILIQLLTYFLYNDLIPVTLTLRVRENIVLHTFTVSSLVWDSREDSDSGNRQTRKQTEPSHIFIPSTPEPETDGSSTDMTTNAIYQDEPPLLLPLSASTSVQEPCLRCNTGGWYGLLPCATSNYSNNSNIHKI